MNQVCNRGVGEFKTKIMHFIKIFKIIKNYFQKIFQSCKISILANISKRFIK